MTFCSIGNCLILSNTIMFGLLVHLYIRYLKTDFRLVIKLFTTAWTML